MASWEEFSAEAPRLAAAVRRGFEAAKHHVLATLRQDGSPRVSGTEVDFRGPDLALGSMGGPGRPPTSGETAGSPSMPTASRARPAARIR